LHLMLRLHKKLRNSLRKMILKYFQLISSITYLMSLLLMLRNVEKREKVTKELKRFFLASWKWWKVPCSIVNHLSLLE
jgi:hypothetical protein